MKTPDNKNLRLFYLDNLRLFLVFCVIIYHSSMTYGPLGSYYFYERSAINDFIVKFPLSFFVVFFKSFFMGLFFYISGFVTPAALEKSGQKRFLLGKLHKLGLPLLLFSAVIYPLLDFYFFYNIKNASFGEILKIYFTRPDPAHLWYIGLLLIFSFLYTLFKNRFDKLFLKITQSSKIAVVISIITFLFLTSFAIRIWFPIGLNILRIPIAYLPQLIIFYAFGIMSYRNKWHNWLSTRDLNKYGVIIFSFIVFLFFIYISVTRINKDLVPLSGGLNTYSLLYTLWETLFSVFISIFLLSFFRQKFDKPLKITSYSFGIYVVHIPMLIYFQLILLIIPIYPLFKFIISVILTVVFSVLLIRITKKPKGS
jgi:glucans biosynthesis protein C